VEAKARSEEEGEESEGNGLDQVAAQLAVHSVCLPTNPSSSSRAASRIRERGLLWE
jgi:hypothetical protein